MTDQPLDAGHLYTGQYGKTFPLRKDCCNTAVHDAGRSVGFHRCGNKIKVRRLVVHRGETLELGYCGLHDPLKIAERRAKREAEWQAQRKADEAKRARARAIEDAKAEAIMILRRISEGHNDPRTAAMQFIIRWDSLTKPVGEG